MNWFQLVSAWVLPIISLILSLFVLANIFGLATIVKALPGAFDEVFQKPAVKHAMSIMGNHSGDARMDKATLDKFNENIGEINPIIGWLSDTLEIEPYALMRMASQEPIKGFIEGVLKNQGSSLGGIGAPAQNQNKSFQKAS